MSIFEYLQTCSTEEFAEWLTEFQNQSEDNVIGQLIKAGYEVTRIQLAKEIRCANMVKWLHEEIKENDPE